MASSAIKGYSSIERAGYKNDKVRLRNMFIGIRSKHPVLKVAETNMISMESNYDAIKNNGAETKENIDIFLAPE